jgi:hypothetical protein
VDAEVEPVVDAEVEPVVDAEVEPVVDAEVEPVVDAEVEPVVDAEVEPVVDAEVEPVVDAEVEPVVDAEVEPVVDAEVEPVVDAEVEPVVDAEVEPVVDTEVEPVVDTDAEPVVDTDTVTEPVVEPGLSTDPEQVLPWTEPPAPVVTELVPEVELPDTAAVPELLNPVEASQPDVQLPSWLEEMLVSPVFSAPPASSPSASGGPSSGSAAGGWPSMEPVWSASSAQPVYERPRPRPSVSPELMSPPREVNVRPWPLNVPIPAPSSTVAASLPSNDRPDRPASVAPRAATPLVVQVNFALGQGGSAATGIVLDRGSISPALQVPAGPEGEMMYILVAKNGLPTDVFGEVLQGIDGVSVLLPGEAGAAQLLRGTVTGVHVSGSSDLALLAVRVDRGALSGLQGSPVASSDQPAGAPVDFIGVDSTRGVVTASGRILQGPTDMLLGATPGSAGAIRPPRAFSRRPSATAGVRCSTATVR